MILLVSGTRYGRDDVEEVLDDHYENNHVSWMVTGGARGVDKQAYEYAKLRGWRVVEIPALWGKDKRSAGHKRNWDMCELARCLSKTLVEDAYVLAFPDRTEPSRGTWNMVSTARDEFRYEVQVVT